MIYSNRLEKIVAIEIGQVVGKFQSHTKEIQKKPVISAN